MPHAGALKNTLKHCIVVLRYVMLVRRSKLLHLCNNNIGFNFTVELQNGQVLSKTNTELDDKWKPWTPR